MQKQFTGKELQMTDDGRNATLHYLAYWIGKNHDFCQDLMMASLWENQWAHMWLVDEQNGKVCMDNNLTTLPKLKIYLPSHPQKL